MDLTRLSVGDSGSKVARVHEKLKTAGITVPGDEIRRMLFGPATRDAVLKYQAKHGLAPTGILDGPTTESLDATVLTGEGPPGTAQRTVAEPKAREPASPQLPATTTHPPSTAGEAGAGAPGTGASPTATPLYMVTGVVSSPGSASVGGLPLRLIDKNVGQDVVLAKSETEATGEFAFRVEIPVQLLQKLHKTHPDLQVQVLHGDTAIAESVVHYDASNDETLDIELPPGLGVLPSEYETLAADIALHYTGPLSELRESDERQDVTYLANKSGWDARAVAMASLADQFGQHRPTMPTSQVAADQPVADHGVGIHPAFYYALFRAGLPADADTLYRTSPNVLQQIWKHAANQGVMPKQLADQADQALAHFQSMAISQALTAPPPVGNSTLGELLQITLGGDATRQQQFADLYVRHQDDYETMWSEAERTFGADTAARLRLDGQLAYLSINNAPLVAALHRDLIERKAQLTSPVDLVSHGYYNAPAWSSLLGDIEVPGQIAGSSPEEQKQNYADLLAAHVRVSFPTAVLGQMVSTGEVPVLGGSDVQTAVASFLTEHQADFDIGAEPIVNYLSRAKATPPPPRG
jgi:Putative peptidoglycan binding domain